MCKNVVWKWEVGWVGDWLERFGKWVTDWRGWVTGWRGWVSQELVGEVGWVDAAIYLAILLAIWVCCWLSISVDSYLEVITSIWQCCHQSSSAATNLAMLPPTWQFCHLSRHLSWPRSYTIVVGPNGPKWPKMAILGHLAPPQLCKKYGHYGCPMKDIIKTSTALKTRGNLDFSIKSYDQKTIFFHFPLKNRLFYLLKN